MTRKAMALWADGVTLGCALPLAVWGQSPALAPREGKPLDASIAKIQAKAERLDANRDGWLTPDETEKGRQSLGMLYGAVVQRVDLNGDGRIAVDEYVQAQVQALRQADVNHDGWISPEEAGAQKRRLIGELLRGTAP